MKDSLIIGISAYILIFVFVGALLPNSFYTGTNYDTSQIDELRNEYSTDLQNSTTPSLSIYSKITKIFFLTPVIEGIPYILSVPIFILNWLFVFIGLIWGYNKLRGIEGT